MCNFSRFNWNCYMENPFVRCMYSIVISLKWQMHIAHLLVLKHLQITSNWKPVSVCVQLFWRTCNGWCLLFDLLDTTCDLFDIETRWFLLNFLFNRNNHTHSNDAILLARFPDELLIHMYPFSISMEKIDSFIVQCTLYH